MKTIKKHGLERAIAIDVYLERRRTRDYVGRLERDGKYFVFTYDDNYRLKDNILALGPDLPITTKSFRSKELFVSFEDRIPSRRNPAWPEYCQHCNISPDEQDLIILLSTLGRRGPSCLIFEGVVPDELKADAISDFRQSLGLTIREFALLFDLSTASVQTLEKAPASTTKRELIKRFRIYLTFPEVALWEVERNRAKVHDRTYDYVVKKLSAVATSQR